MNAVLKGGNKSCKFADIITNKHSGGLG